MDKIGSFTSPRHGQVHVLRACYGGPGGPTAIVLQCANGEPLATLSVNMYRPQCSRDSRQLPKNCFYVKRWSENEQISAEALASGLFLERPDLPEAKSGHVSAPVWQVRCGGN